MCNTTIDSGALVFIKGEGPRALYEVRCVYNDTNFYGGQRAKLQKVDVPFGPPNATMIDRPVGRLDLVGWLCP